MTRGDSRAWEIEGGSACPTEKGVRAVDGCMWVWGVVVGRPFLRGVRPTDDMFSLLGDKVSVKYDEPRVAARVSSFSSL